MTEADQRLKDCVSTTELAMGIKTWATAGRIESQVRKISDRSDEDECENILKWLSPLDFNRIHSRLLKRVDYTSSAGSWLLQSKSFTLWRDGDDHHRLWYTGAPGAGKSVLASIITNHLQEWSVMQRNAPKRALVACLFLSYKEKPSLEPLLGSILRQLESSSAELSGAVRNAFQECHKSERSLRMCQITDLLSLLTKERQVFVVVDAMDECEFELRLPLLERLRSTENSVKILVTSRVLNHLDRLQQGFIREKIEAHDEDLTEYIEHSIRVSPILEQFSDKIIKTVPQKSGKMFLIAQLHMDALIQVEISYEVEKVLQNLPDNDIWKSYDNTMSRIQEGKRKQEKEYANTILGWISYAARPLSVQELQHALVADKNLSKIDESFLLSESQIMSFARGLLVVDLDGMLRYVHYSAQDFFKQRRRHYFPDFETRIAIACANYLCRTELGQRNDSEGFLESDQSVARKLKRFPFARYAGEYLHRHYRKVRNGSSDLHPTEKILDLIDRNSSRKFYCKLLSMFDLYYSGTKILDKIKKKDQRTKDHPLPILHLAVFLGSAEKVKNLIDEGHNLNELDPYEQSALDVALNNGLDDIAGILLDGGTKIDLGSRRGHEILLYAAEKDYEKAVEKIIGSPASDEVGGILAIIGIVVFWLLSILHEALHAVLPVAAPSRHESEVVRKSDARSLHAANVDPLIEKYRALLPWAYAGDVDSLLDFLDSLFIKPIQLDNDSDTEDLTYYDQLSVASDSDFENEDADENLLKIDDKNDERKSEKKVRFAMLRTACFLAVEHGQDGIVKVLLEKGLDPSTTNPQGQPLLHRATARNNLEVARLLLKHGAEVNQRDFDGRTALTANASISRQRLLDFLIEQGAKIQPYHRAGNHEMYEAAMYGATGVVEFFLKNGTDASITNDFGWTPLHGAAANGHLEIVKLLLEHDAYTSPISDTGRTPLDFVVSGLSHYEWGFTAERHYKADALLSEELSVVDRQRRRDEIVDLLRSKGAKESREIYEEIGRDEFEYGHGGQFTHLTGSLGAKKRGF
ncbi:ankyrin repeat protein [Phyllosticta capitalensis]